MNMIQHRLLLPQTMSLEKLKTSSVQRKLYHDNGNMTETERKLVAGGAAAG